MNRPVVDCQNAGDRGKSRTVQSHREACDIPSIVAKYKRTGQLPIMRMQARQGSFGDFSDAPEYQECLNRVIEAQTAFDALPARVKERFRNDPANLLAFLADEKNTEEAVALGLVEKPAPEPAPLKVTIEPPAEHEGSSSGAAA